jgi:hypothetical protein
MSLNTPTPLYTTKSTEDFHHIAIVSILRWLSDEVAIDLFCGGLSGFKRPRSRSLEPLRQTTAIAHQDDQQAPPEDYSSTNASLVSNP